MPRAARFFSREGIDFIPYPSDYRINAKMIWSPYSVVPQSAYLLDSCLAIKEYVGIAAASLGMQ